MRILVSGSRYFINYDLLRKTLDEFPINHIISGGATGADTLAERYAKGLQVPYTVYPAQWVVYGKAAGPIRNKQMLDEGKPDMVVAFLAPNSRGTKNMIEQSEKAGIPVKIIEISN